MNMGRDIGRDTETNMKGQSMKGIYTRKKSAHTGRTSKRISYRNSFLLFTVLFSVLFMLLFYTHRDSLAMAADGNTEPLYKYYTTITIEKGQTLWDIAEEYQSDRYYDSIDDYIEEVKRINGLNSDMIHEGAKLVIVYFSNEYK